MPAAANNLLVVEQRLWTIALAWGGFTALVLPGNRVRLDQLGIQWPPQEGKALAPADAVQVKLDVPGGGRPDPHGPRTMCLQPDVTAYDYLWTLTAANRQLNAVSQVHAELKAAMVAAGTQLGIPAIVARWEQELRPGKASDKDRQLLWVQRVTIKG